VVTYPPRPPAIPGAPAARPVDALRLVWWLERGLLHGARHGRGAGRALSAFSAVLWWPTVPVLLPIQAALIASPRARYYMTPQRDGVLAVIATRHGWRVEGHAAARPGTGEGRALRALVLPALLAAADTHQVPILASTATASLAATYRAEVPGLVDLGRARPRGRHLRREPQMTTHRPAHPLPPQHGHDDPP
jgi:hypothetical protein